MTSFLKRLMRGKITKREKELLVFSFFSFTFLYISAASFRDWFIKVIDKYLPSFTLNIFGVDLRITSIIMGLLGMMLLYKIFREE